MLTEKQTLSEANMFFVFRVQKMIKYGIKVTRTNVAAAKPCT